MDLALHCQEKPKNKKINNGKRWLHKLEKREPLKTLVPLQAYFFFPQNSLLETLAQRPP